MEIQGNNLTNWGNQFCKGIFLAVNSVGLGWLMGRLWKGPEDQEGNPIEANHQLISYNRKGDNYSWSNMGSSCNEPVGTYQLQSRSETLFQRMDIAYRSSIEKVSDTWGCGIGLTVGGLGSLALGSPLPLSAGATFCLPTTSAESTIPDDIFRRQKNLDAGVDFGNFLIEVAGTGAGGFIGSIGGIGGAFAGAAVGASLLHSFKFSKSKPLCDLYRKNFNEMRESAAKDSKFFADPIGIRLKIGADLLNSLSDSRLDLLDGKNAYEMLHVKEFLMQTQEILETQAKLNQGFATTLGGLGDKVNSQLSGHVKELGQKYAAAAEQLGKFTAQLGNVKRGVQETQDTLKSFVSETKASFEDVNTQIKAVQLQQNEMQELTTHLVREAMILSTQGFESSKKIMRLEKELHELQLKPDLTEAIGKVVELKRAIQDEQKKRVEFDQALQGIGSGFELIGLAAAFGGNSKLAHQISTIGRSAITIATAVSSLAGFGTAAAGVAAGIAAGGLTAGFAVLGPIGAIAGAAFAIFQLFWDSGPTIEEEILKAVQELAESLRMVRKEMHERFDAVEDMLVKHHKYTAIRFDRLEQMLETIHTHMHKRFDHLLDVTLSLHKSVINQLISIKEDTETTRQMVGAIRDQLNRIENKVDASFRKIYTQLVYSTLRSEALNYHRIPPYVEMTKERRKYYFEKFYTWASEGVMHEFVTKTTPKQPTFDDVAKAVEEHGIDSSIQSLAAFAHAQLGLKGGDTLPNPSLWADAVDTVLEFIWRTPELEIEFGHKQLIKDISNVGLRFQHFVVALQTSPKVYETLMQRYRSDLDALQSVFKQLVLETIERNGEPLSLDVVQKEVGNVRISGLHRDFQVLNETYKNISKVRQAFVENINMVDTTRNLDTYTRPKNFFSFVYDYQSVSNYFFEKLKDNNKTLGSSLDTFGDDLDILYTHIEKAAEIDKSAEKTYFLAQRYLSVWAKIQPGARQIDQIEKRLREAITNLPEIDDMYAYLLHHLSQEEQEEIKATLELELAKPGSPLNGAIDKIQASHVLFEAYLQLGFQSEFYHNYEFRKLFEGIWSANAVRFSIYNWNVKEPESMPFIQIVDKALPGLDDLQAAVMDKVTDYQLARQETPFTSLQGSGHALVDITQYKLHLFESIFFDSPTQKEHDEL